MRARSLGLIMLALAAAPAAATPLEDRLREQLQSTVTQLRELQNGKAALEAAKAAAEKERDAAKAKPKASADDGRALAAAKSQNAALSAKAGATATALAAAQARIAELTTGLTAAQTEVAQLQQGTAATTASATASAAALQACADRNMRLVATARDLVTLHQRRYGFGSFPPLQILRTRIETEAQAAGDKVNADIMPPLPAAGAKK